MGTLQKQHFCIVQFGRINRFFLNETIKLETIQNNSGLEFHDTKLKQLTV